MALVVNRIMCATMMNLGYNEFIFPVLPPFAAPVPIFHNNALSVVLLIGPVIVDCADFFLQKPELPGSLNLMQEL
jgi:hypothetical protein